MTDVERFLCLDPLHRAIRVEGDGPLSVGSRFILPHRLLGVGPDRVGRLLRWREGAGYAISDLSRRDVTVGFPHICTYEVVATGAHTCRLTIGARGRWTATWTPRWVVKAWIWWVLKATESRVLIHMLRT
jgi:hypothetical protein